MTATASIWNRLTGAVSRAAQSVSMQIRVATANLWRDWYNPLRGLTMRRAVQLLEDEARGAYADLQWTYRSIEGQDATLGALVERRISAIRQLDWDIKIREDVPEGKRAVAERQREALKAAYEGVENLGEAIAYLALATFRGYSHLEKVEVEGGRVSRLEPVEQWYWVREGLHGEWKLNIAATPGTTKGEPVDLERFVVREVERPVNRVALVCFVRKGLSQKDWDAFIEQFGIPAVFITLPTEVPKDKLEEYIAMAERITGDSRGVLPGGSEVKTVDNGTRGVNPFRDHIRFQDEQLVLRGTGGLLTMLTESGSGTLAGGAHQEAFDLLARAEAAAISEVLREQFDADVLYATTPDEPAWAYFELAANEETDSAQVVKDVAVLTRAGYRVDPAWLAEKSGYPVDRPEESGAEEPDSGASTVHRRANRPEGEAPDSGGGQSAPGSESSTERNVKNREISGLGGNSAPDPDPARDWLDAAAESAFRAALESGGSQPLEAALLAAAVAGLATVVEGDDGGTILNAGTSDGARKGWETRRRNGWSPKHFKEATAKGDDLAEFFESSIAEPGGSPNKKLEWAKVSPAEAEALASATGLDVSGYAHTLDNSSARHLHKAHGDPQNEVPRGQIAITAEDLRQLPRHIAEADEIEYAGTTKQGRDAIRYYHDEAGTTVVIEEVRTGRRELVPTTMRRHRGKFREPKTESGDERVPAE